MLNDQDGSVTGTSVFKKSARCVIGRNKTDILNEKYHKRERDQVPGPGKYARFSDFNETLN